MGSRGLLFLLLSIYLIQLSYAALVSVRVVPESLAAHKTAGYRFPANQRPLIVRRGFSFQVLITSDTPVPDTQGISISSTPSNIFTVPTVNKTSVPTQFIATITSKPNAPIGKFQTNLNLALLANGQILQSIPLSAIPVYVLYNPYNPQDQLYIDPSLVGEYVENEYGDHWTGSTNNYQQRRWFYGQYNPFSLGAALSLIYSLTANGKSADPVALSRYLTFVSTAQDAVPRGVLVGNWGSDFSGGVQPTRWVSSPDILTKFVNTSFKPVKFAQCWVFGGILTTLLRTLGAPARQIFTFGSGHESPDDNGEYRQIIEFHYDSKTGSLVDTVGSVWNFHSWTELWLNTRADAPNGWQTVDATPQEMSDGVYQTGPAPVSAVKQFNPNANFDTPFVKSEVDAVIEDWVDNCKGKKCTPGYLYSNKRRTGDLILTKKVGADAALDVTNTYKNVNKKREAEQLGDIQLEVAHDQLRFGENIRIVAHLSSAKDAEIELLSEIKMMAYNGKTQGSLKNFNHNVQLNAANQFTASVVLEIPVEEYQNVLGQHHLQVTCFGKIKDQEKPVIHYSQVSLQPSSLKFDVLGKASFLGESNTWLVAHETEAKVVISFTNPLSIPLTGAVINVHPGALNAHHQKDEDVEQAIGTIAPGGTWTTTIPVLTIGRGSHSLIASLTSTELHTHGYVTFTTDV